MRFIVLALYVIASTYSFCQTSEAEKINALHKRKFEWLISVNVDSLNALLAPEINYIHSNGWIQNRPEVLADMKNGKLRYQAVEVEESSVKIHENTALVTGKGNFSGVMNGTAFSIKLLYTEVYVKISNKWKLAARHACKVQ